MYSSAGVGGLSMSGAGSVLTYADVSDGQYGLVMPDAATTRAYFEVKLPDNYVDGTTMLPYIDWCATDATTGNVRWSFIYSYQFDTTGVFTSANAQTVVQAVAGDVTAVEQSDDWAEIAAPTGMSRNAIILCQIIRLGSHATDTYAADACLLGAGFKFKVAAVGHERKF
jgi:hypothetical protein